MKTTSSIFNALKSVSFSYQNLSLITSTIFFFAVSVNLFAFRTDSLSVTSIETTSAIVVPQMTYLLYDIDNNATYTLVAGSNTFDTSVIGSNIAIEAISNESVGSMYMDIFNTSGTLLEGHNENLGPYFFPGGNSGTTPTSWTRPNGQLNCTIRIYAVRAGEAASATPVLEESFSINFVDNVITQVPDAPSTLEIVPGTLTDTSVTLNLPDIPTDQGITSFKIYYDEGVTQQRVVNSFPYQLTGLTPDTQYNIRAAALNSAGESIQSLQAVGVKTELASGGGDNTSGGVWSASGSDIYYSTGNVGIGTQNIGEWQLAVGGKIRAEEIKVDTGWADYVFKDSYKLPTLQEVEKHIQEKGHLINIPSAEEVENNGIELGEMNKLLLEKIEELTLYTLQQQKEIQNLKDIISKQ